MISEALHIFKRRMQGEKAIPQYLGSANSSASANSICKQIITNCFNGEFFQASAGNFACFYIRDFGMCIKSLLNLGYKKEAESTLSFALKTYAKQDRITTTITRDGKCVDYFNIAPDSLAFLLYSLRIAKDKKVAKDKPIVNTKALVLEHKLFLEKEIRRYFETIVDQSTGLVKKGYFSSIKDHAVRNSSCYDNCMLAMISREADELELENPFKKFNYPALIKTYFWSENENKQSGYFKDDIDNDVPTGDANVFPYWCGVFDCAYEDKEMAKSSIKTIKENKLDQPFPLKYSSNAKYDNFLFLPSLFAGNYEGNTIWMHLGLCYLDIIAICDRKLFKTYLNQCLNKYKELIKIHKNFLEVYNANGTIYKSPFYLCDDSMLWCSKYLDLSLSPKQVKM